MVTLLQGDCRDVLKTLPDASVNCCVTSPPYWGLRDYGTAKWEGGDAGCNHSVGGQVQDGKAPGAITTGQRPGVDASVCRKCGARRIDSQIGLEKTPEEFVAELVAVFREVRRVLRQDGVLFLNLGDSFMSHPGQRKATDKASQKQRSNRGSTATPSRASGDTPPTRSRFDAPACGTDGTALPDSQGFDCAYPCLCDACLVGVLRSRSERTSRPLSSTPSAPGSKDHDSGRSDSVAEVPQPLPLDAPASTRPESSPQLSASRWRCAMCGADLSTVRSSISCAHRFAGTSDAATEKPSCTAGTASPSAEPPRHIRCTSESCSLRVSSDTSCIVQPECTKDAKWSQHLKPKDLVGIPWRVAFALQADGWYLRSDIIWAKANCMPESVTDRPTRSHEYIFLLTKRDRYYYDHEAIKEPCIYDLDGTGTAARKERQKEGAKSMPTAERHGIRPPKADKQRGHSRRHDGFNDRWDKMEKEKQCTGMRNKRDVWNVAPANYPEAHFATFPPDLVRPCILAGCPVGGTVIDPFGGSGTTGEVAEMEGRNSILIDLNQSYIELQKRRTAQMGLFCQNKEDAR